MAEEISLATCVTRDPLLPQCDWSPWPFSAPSHHDLCQKAFKHTTWALDSPFPLGLFPHLSHSSHTWLPYPPPSREGGERIKSLRPELWGVNEGICGWDKLHSKEVKLDYNGRVSEHLHAPNLHTHFCKPTVTPGEKNMHIHTGASLLSFTPSQPAFRDNALWITCGPRLVAQLV